MGPKAKDKTPKRRPSGEEERDVDSIGERTRHIKNKMRRSEVYLKLKTDLKKQKRQARNQRKEERERAEELGQEPPPRLVQRTIDNTRKADETVVRPGDDEVEAEDAQDEFAEHFSCAHPPKVMVTTNRRCSRAMFAFLAEFMEALPCAHFCERRGFEIKKIVQFANNENFSDILIFNEDRKKVDGVMHIHLPDGPTARYRLISLKLSKDIANCGRSTEHRPELILKGFTTRLGHRVGRMFASLFHQNPEFVGRRVATFHNQRDFIFFRHHRYVFEEKEKRDKPGGEKTKQVGARLQELGPRFTLRLQSLQKGTFDSRHGEFEWVRKNELVDSKKRFFL